MFNSFDILHQKQYFLTFSWGKFCALVNSILVILVPIHSMINASFNKFSFLTITNSFDILHKK
nr:MAG TPA: hypothetical protein [Bacteriophage sp.]